VCPVVGLGDDPSPIVQASLANLRSLAQAVGRPDIFALDRLADLIATVWNHPDLTEVSAIPEGSPDPVFCWMGSGAAAEVCALILFEPFLPMLPADGGPTDLGRVVELERRIGSFSECGQALRYAGVTRTEVGRVLATCEIIAHDLGVPVSGLLEISALAHVAEWRMRKQRRVDFFPVPVYEGTEVKVHVQQRDRETTGTGKGQMAKDAEDRMEDR
jgi:hypothetical protein